MQCARVYYVDGTAVNRIHWQVFLLFVFSILIPITVAIKCETRALARAYLSFSQFVYASVLVCHCLSVRMFRLFFLIEIDTRRDFGKRIVHTAVGRRELFT